MDIINLFSSLFFFLCRFLTKLRIHLNKDLHIPIIVIVLNGGGVTLQSVIDGMHFLQLSYLYLAILGSYRLIF